MSVAVVVGGSRGLGLLCARELRRRGYTTIITARHQDELDRAVEQLDQWADAAPGQGGGVAAMVCDVAHRDQVGQVLHRIEKEHGPIEVCLTVAGIIQVAPPEAVTLAHFDEAIAIMLQGPINVAWQVLPMMRARQRGRIGTVTSVGGVVSPPHLLPYAAAKFGAVGFSDGLAAALAGTGVRATTIIPGLMRTGSHLRALFAGEVGREYAWFAPAAALPLVSMNADRAAVRIVDAVLRGAPLLTLTPLTWVALRVRGLMPATTTRVMGVVHRLLPTGDSSETVTGHEARQRLRSHGLAHRVVEALTLLGTRAAQRNNQN